MSWPSPPGRREYGVYVDPALGAAKASSAETAVITNRNKEYRRTIRRKELTVEFQTPAMVERVGRRML